MSALRNSAPVSGNFLDLAHHRLAIPRTHADVDHQRRAIADDDADVQDEDDIVIGDDVDVLRDLLGRVLANQRRRQVAATAARALCRGQQRDE